MLEIYVIYNSHIYRKNHLTGAGLYMIVCVFTDSS